MKILAHNQYKKMPWKNGQGTTNEIEIYPESSNLNDNFFLYRLSSAEITCDGEFSIFHNCNRLLLIYQGDGLYLNKKKLLPFEVIQFSGEEKIQYQMINPKNTILDFGIIYNKKKVQVQFSEFKTDQDCEISKYDYLFLAQGLLNIETFILNPKDTLKIKRETINVSPLKYSIFYTFKLKLIS